MRIDNVRLGFAANSSSTHSLIFLPDAVDQGGEDLYFGWDFFTLASEKARRGYLAQTLFQNLCDLTTEAQAVAIVKQWVGVSLKQQPGLHGDPDRRYGGYLDHQSLYALPREWDGRGLDLPFFRAFQEYLLQPGLVILGGNDNTEESHPLAPQGEDFQLDLPLDDLGWEPGRGWVCRSEVPGIWTLFNRNTGARIRFSFDRNVPPLEKARAPELVDIKITEVCPHGCQFCYMDSQPEGRHAEYADLRHLAWSLGSLRCFEVALGGGEPTLHPDFLLILEAFRQEGVVPNFTTRSLDWLNRPHLWHRVRQLCGEVAFSLRSAEELRHLHRLLVDRDWEPHPYGRPRGAAVSVQVVEDTLSPDALSELLNEAAECEFPVTLLGFKAQGRGRTYPRQDGETFRVLVKHLQGESDCRMPALRVDTTFARRWEEQLKQIEVPEWLYTTEEGAFSCFIDAVAGTIAPASYGEDLPSYTLNLRGPSQALTRQIQETFARF